MVAITQAQYELLIHNGEYQREGLDQYPVVKFYLPSSSLVWLFTKMNHSDPHMLYGLWDYGVGQVEEGWFDVTGLDLIESFHGDIVQQDTNFSATYPLSVYRKAANSFGHIVEADSILKKFSIKKSSGPNPQ